MKRHKKQIPLGRVVRADNPHEMAALAEQNPATSRMLQEVFAQSMAAIIRARTTGRLKSRQSLIPLIGLQKFHAEVATTMASSL